MRGEKSRDTPEKITGFQKRLVHLSSPEHDVYIWITGFTQSSFYLLFPFERTAPPSLSSVLQDYLLSTQRNTTVGKNSLPFGIATGEML